MNTRNFVPRRSEARAAASVPHSGRKRLRVAIAFVSLLLFVSTGLAQKLAPANTVPPPMMLTILRAEDQRRWDEVMTALLRDPNPAVRRRAALAAGRIGAATTVEPLVQVLSTDSDVSVRAMAAFALGETELATASAPLQMALQLKDQPAEVRARAIEGLGKIVAAGGTAKTEEFKPVGQLILSTLAAEGAKGSSADREVVLKGLTAVLRSRPEKAGAVLVQFLDSSDGRIRADTGNTLARLKAPEGNEKLRALVKSDPDPVVRANAARVLGATTDKTSFDVILDRATNDPDQRVRVSAIRALGALKDERALNLLMFRATYPAETDPSQTVIGPKAIPAGRTELLEIATAVANIKGVSDDPIWARSARKKLAGPTGVSADAEIEIALAKLSPSAYVDESFIPDDLRGRPSQVFAAWRNTSGVAQGLGAIAEMKDEVYGANLAGWQARAVVILGVILDDPRLSNSARGDVLSAYAAFKPTDARARARTALNNTDYVVRGTAAGILSELAPDPADEKALIELVGKELKNRETNDVVLGALDALAKQKTGSANAAIKGALDSTDILVRQRAINLLKENKAGDFSARLGNPASKFSEADYRRALRLRNGVVRATVTTSKGYFVITFVPGDAPLTVDNFVTLARRKYFDGIIFHRVVANFVAQAGDPRGDGNGGPGYQIRCEINEHQYGRGAVGMALSGKDTGGSQWFVTHSPQPHLDGGYTVFGTVSEHDMAVVDAIDRGDKIISIRISETRNRPAGN
ncbi:MAG: HEAT repeat domain-containing protein [Pyrinomonadaceae bacterium]